MPPALQLSHAELFRTLPGPYIVFANDDPVFTIVEENEAHAVMAMVTRSKVLGKPLLKAFPDTSEQYVKHGRSELLDSLRSVARTKEPDTMPLLRYDLKDRSGHMVERYWRVTHYPLVDETGKVTHLFQATQDITEEITTSKRLLVAERQLAQALSVGSIGTWLWDINKNIVIADKNLSHMFGISALKGAAGLPLEDFVASIYEPDRRRVQKAIEKTMRTRGNFENEYRTISRDGTTRWVLARGRVETDKNNQPVSFPGVIVDITERKQAENNLHLLSRASTELAASLNYKKTLKTIARLMVPDIADWCTIEILDAQGVLQSVAVMHKDPHKVAWARQLRDQQGPTDLSQPNGVAEVLRSGKSEYYPAISDELLVASAKSKKELKLLRDLSLSSIIIVPLKVSNKTVGALTLISTEQKRNYTLSDLQMAEDLGNRASLAMTNASLYENAQLEITRRRKLEDELRIANEELEARVEARTAELEAANSDLNRSNQELEDFAYVASHDLQEPLRKIQAFGNLLESEYADQLGEGADYLARMRNAAARMSNLIEDILSFSRVTTKARGFARIDLTQITHEVLGDLETRIAETNAIIKVGDLPKLSADAMQMRQLLQNLIGNALKFHRENVPPHINITATTSTDPKTKQKCCILRVEDNGVGFDEKYLDRIFAVFQRLHGRETYEGTGIGLAVCRKITARHGGSITATSKLGVGSTFIITLPMNHKNDVA